MTPGELEALLRQHLDDSPNSVAARARAAAELMELTGIPVPDARSAVELAFTRIASEDRAEGQAGQPDPPEALPHAQVTERNADAPR